MSHVDEGTLHAFLDGALDADAERRVEDHLADCRACAAELEDAAELHARSARLMEGLGVEPATPEFADLVARAEATEPLEQGPSFLLPGLAWAATLALAFFLGWQSANRSELVVAPDRAAPAARPQPAEPPAAEPPLESMRALNDETVSESSDAIAAAANDEDAAVADSELEADSTDDDADPGTAREQEEARQESGRAATETAEQDAASRAAAERFRAAAPPPDPVRVLAPQAQGQMPVAAGEWEARREPELIFLRDGAARELPAGIRLDVDAVSADWLGAPPLRLDGAGLQEVRVVPATVFPDGAAGRTVLRSSYLLPESGVRVEIWQQWLGAETAEQIDEDDPEGARAATPAGIRSDGQTMLEWDDPRGYRVRLMAPLPIGDLRVLAQRLVLDDAR